MTTLSTGDFEMMKANQSINRGMIPKLHNGFKALGSGVEEVRICGIDNLTNGHMSTRLIQ